MSRYAAALLLVLRIVGGFAPRAVNCERPGGHGQQSLYPETNLKSMRSIEMDDFKIEDVFETSKGSDPVILKLHTPVAKPAPLHANLPLRFGRSSPRVAAWMSLSPLSVTRHFRRSLETDSPIALPCHQCARAGGVAAPSATLPQRFGRTNHFNSRPARTLAMFARRISAQPQRRSQGRNFSSDHVDDVREEVILSFPKILEASGISA